MKSMIRHQCGGLKKRRKSSTWLLAVIGASLPTAWGSIAQAAETSGESAGSGGLISPDPGMALATFVIFVVLLIILGRLAWPPLIAGLKRREDAIRESIQAAADAQAEVERTRKMLEEKIAEVQLQAAAQLQQAKSDALKAAEKIQQNAESESRALKDQALRDIAAARQQALEQIAELAANVSIKVAARILEREITPSDQQRLVTESIEELSAAEQR
jgi:F-type H+-transporting ATPase subunit b